MLTPLCVWGGGGVLYGFNGLISLVGLEEGVTSGNWSPTAVEEQSEGKVPVSELCSSQGPGLEVLGGLLYVAGDWFGTHGEEAEVGHCGDTGS